MIETRISDKDVMEYKYQENQFTDYVFMICDENSKLKFDILF